MKMRSFILMFILLLSTHNEAQNLMNNNWVFGKNRWNFNLSTSGSVARTAISFPGYDVKFRYQSSSISNPSTGEFMFVTDGFNVYNKNFTLMDNGGNLLSIPDTPGGARLAAIDYYGNKTGQGSLILPHPGNSNLYYIFSLSIAYQYNDEASIPMGIVNVPGYGLSYSIVDMSQNGGLGRVTSRNNSLLSASYGTQGMTSAIASDGISYWVITYRGNQFLAYKVGTTGLNTTPIVSTTPYSHVVGDFLKISPNGKHIFVRHEPTTKAMLYDFNSSTGVISGGTNILQYADSLNPPYIYMDQSFISLNSSEFSSDSNILYFIGAQKYGMLYPYPFVGKSGLISYNIDTSEFIDYDNGEYAIPCHSATLQRGSDGKIYIIELTTLNDDGFNHYHTTIKGWRVINNPNNWGNTNPLSASINSPAIHGLSFPQLIPSSLPCPSNLNITTPITSSNDFQVSNRIEASSVISQNINVNFKGNEIVLKPGFSVSGFNTGNFSATIDPCIAALAPLKEEEEDSKTKSYSNDESKFIEPILFPNPATSVLNINQVEDIIEWKLVDIYGKTIDSGRMNHLIQEKITINTSLLIPGVYYFNALMKNGELFQEKVIKK